MNIYIMSRGRAGRTTTQKWIPASWVHRTFFVVPDSEADMYRAFNPTFKVKSVPPSVTNYSQKFQYLMEVPDLNDKCLIIDDDLVFSSRSDAANPNSLISIKDANMLEPMWSRIEDTLDEFPLVGVHPRQMGQHAVRPYVVNGRIICMQGINRVTIGGPIRVDQHPILADVVLACTLLGRGLPNALLTTFFQDHGPCQAPGGCSIYRTPDMQRAAVDYLAARWPGFVKVVVRKPKVAKWMGDERYEYTCQWKRLYAAGVAWRRGQGPSPDRECPRALAVLDTGAV